MSGSEIGAGIAEKGEVLLPRQDSTSCLTAAE